MLEYYQGRVRGAPSPFGQRSIKFHDKNAFLTAYLWFYGDHGPDCGQPQINFIKINQNFAYFQIILEQLFVDEFNQKWSPKGVIFAKKKPIFAQRLEASIPDP